MAGIFLLTGLICYGVSYILTIYYGNYKPARIFTIIGFTIFGVGILIWMINIHEDNKQFDEHKHQCITLYRPDYNKMTQCIGFYEKVDK